MQRRVFLVFAVLLCLPIAAQSAVIIVGNNLLLPNTAGQKVNVLISGTDIINGGDLAAQVGSGNQVNGPNALDGPAITGADIVGAAGFNATIFTGNNSTQANVQIGPGFNRNIEVGTTTALADFSATANGQFGTLVFSTVGIFATNVQQTWALLLGGPNNDTVPGFSSTDIGTDPVGGTLFPTITDGTVFIAGAPIPEPSSMLLGLFAAAGLAAVAIRRRRRA